MRESAHSSSLPFLHFVLLPTFPLFFPAALLVPPLLVSLAVAILQRRRSCFYRACTCIVCTCCAWMCVKWCIKPLCTNERTDGEGWLRFSFNHRNIYSSLAIFVCSFSYLFLPHPHKSLTTVLVTFLKNNNMIQFMNYLNRAFIFQINSETLNIVNAPALLPQLP